MSDCKEERRQDYPDLRYMVGQIDERTKMILSGQEKLATVESVKNVTDRLERHINSHVSRGNIVAVWVGISASSALGIGGIIVTIFSFLK